ncbi:NUDIX domain-containing protein [Acinetobacter rathckeae]|uniref:NUDIX domain-containing protein n=1 Tax=Acinetobacter rathckeae TaxID=2605272 RepID=UPI0018A2F257|nr:(deoxy)nucleoside triphosphate pyrophosphohydrolase [Acinetobacter rathckeae]MBF7687409.1 (deoxy)nucleoside triphosphate pyrophosphohydrolase [Acinetobacter rathckeae]MBF7694810.1 (deoxy)nucleoside triphosphate pyrophosphohydrolase [Acinetobacter rathckeae]
MSKTEVNVAIALIVCEKSVLVGWRGAEQHQGNKNEFPGGKLEHGETPEGACQREIFEEVGIQISDWQQVDFIQHEYDDVIVNLYVHLSEVDAMQYAQIKAPWFWVECHQIQTLNFPKANDVILKRLSEGKYFQ